MNIQTIVLAGAATQKEYQPQAKVVSMESEFINPGQKITEDLIGEFRIWISINFSDDTINCYSHTVTKRCLDKTISAVNRKDFFIELARDLKERNASPSTITRYTAAVKKFLVFLNEKYEMPIINLDTIHCCRSPKQNPTYLEKEEIGAIRRIPVRTIMELRDRALFEFLLYSGCRISEALGIEWATIDFEKNEVEVLGKGSKKRIVFLNESKGWIKEYLEHRESDSKYLFVTQYKLRRLQRGNAATAIRKLGRKAGITQKVHPHLLRHTFGTYLIWAGVDPRTVQEMMGHNDLETTLRYYSAVTQDRMREANSELGHFIGDQKPATQPKPDAVYPLYG